MVYTDISASIYDSDNPALGNIHKGVTQMWETFAPNPLLKNVLQLTSYNTIEKIT
jgi:hypothetical protein